MRELRHALDDDARQPRYIETRHRRGYRLIGSLGRPTAPSGGGDARTVTLAVLPFQNLSDDPEQEYFADGIVEDMIAALSHVKSLLVIARTSSFGYKGKAIDIRQVGCELGVRYVLKGSVRKIGNRLRIAGQLIDSQTGAHLWADHFDGAVEDIFDLQDQVTGRVVATVGRRLEQAEIQRTWHRPTRNLDAYDCYLRGLTRFHEYTKPGLDEGLRLARRAIELDPEFSAAYGLAAVCHCVRFGMGFIDEPERAEVEVRRMAARVAAIGRDDAYALARTGVALIRVCRDLETGAALIDQALAVDPNLPVAHINRAEVDLHRGNHAAVIGRITRAMRLNPRDPVIFMAHLNMALAHLFEGRYSEAIACSMQVLSFNPTNAAAHRVAACAHALIGRTEEAAKFAARHRDLAPSYRIGEARKLSPYRRPQDVERLFEGLRLAGVPE